MKSEGSPEVDSFGKVADWPSAAVAEAYACAGSVEFRPLLRCRRKRGRVGVTLLRGATRSSADESEPSEWLLSRLGTSDESEQQSSSSVIIVSGGEHELSKSEEDAVDGVWALMIDEFASRVIAAKVI